MLALCIALSVVAAAEVARVDLAPVPPPRPSEAGEDPFGPQRHDPAQSLHGIFGADPRAFDQQDTAPLRHAMARWLADSIGANLRQSDTASGRFSGP